MSSEKVYVDGKEISVPSNYSILQACQSAGAHVNTLCHHPRLPPSGKCGVCVVEVEGDEVPFKLSCSTRVQPGMKILTNSRGAKIRSSLALRKILSSSLSIPHQKPDEDPFVKKLRIDAESLIDDSSPSIVFDQSKCIGCTRCVRACAMQGMNVLSSASDPNMPATITQEGLPLIETDCISCGQCSSFCPVGAITEKDDVAEVLRALDDPTVIPVLQTAPSPRVAIAECFGHKPGDASTSKLVGAAKQAGFSFVFDTNFGADLTIIEEANELLNRIKAGGPFPMFTSCCPAWINLIEKKYPKLLPNLSSCRSPMMMVGPLVKTYFAEKAGLPSSKIFQVALMPCTAKKEEIRRPQMFRNGKRDVDVVLTTREFARLLKQRGIDWEIVLDAEYDNPLGEASGAAQIFGSSGGVMEAALRTAYELVSSKPLPKIIFEEVRGLLGVKEAKVDLNGLVLKVAVINGAGNVRQFLEKVAKGERDEHFVEIMCCSGGCIGGGGQPQSEDPAVLEKRAAAIYSIDDLAQVRKSHENPAIKQLYAEFLQAPGSHKAHELLHTTYADRARINVRASVPSPGGDGIGLLILYGSQGGSTAALAKEFATEANRASKGLPVRCQSLDSYDPNQLLDERRLAVMCSTFSEGEFPGNAKNFWEGISKFNGCSPPLADLRFCVCAFGSSSYSLFCAAGKQLDERLSALGALRVLDPTFVDEKSAGKGLEGYYEWARKALVALLGATEAFNEPPLPKYSVSLGVSLGRTVRRAKPCPPGFHFAVLSESREVTTAKYERPVRLFDFDLEGSSISYNVGDHAYILPRNDDHSVLVLLDFLGLPSHTVVSITLAPGQPPESIPFPPQLELEELFSQYLDILAPVTRRFVQQMARFSTDIDEQEELLRLSDDAHKQEFPTFSMLNSFADTLRAFPSSIPPLENIVGMLPIIKPRAYSIASSETAFPHHMQLSIVLYQYRVSGSSLRSGLCTSYLFGLNPTSKPKVAVMVKKGILLPPADTTTPIIMVGLGTGIAPFRGFLQERTRLKQDSKVLGPALFYFGCRHRAKDFIFRDELREFQKEGVLTELVSVFSHDQAYFIFVQDSMKEDYRPFTEILTHPNTHLYYCGPAMGIPQQVIAALKDGLTQLGENAENIFSDMNKNKRIHIEAY